MCNGVKTAGRSARTALALASRCTDQQFFEDSPLVKAQAFPKHGARATSEPSKPARPLEWRHIEALESLIEAGTTAQQRVLAGFFVFLIHTSHRCSDGQRSRKLCLTEDALMGEALMKGETFVDEMGRPTPRPHARRLGSGLDERALEQRFAR